MIPGYLIGTLARFSLILTWFFIVTVSPAQVTFSQLAAGEMDDRSVLLQVRVSGAGTTDRLWFECGTDSLFRKKGLIRQAGTPSFGTDSLVKVRLNSLSPGETYFYRICHSGPDGKELAGPSGRFKTLMGNRKGDVRFILSSCMHYDKFMYGPKMDGNGAKGTPREEVGFPGLKPIRDLKPDFWILNGDNVYYDHNFPVDKEWENRAKTREQLREKWHLLFAMPSLAKAVRSTGTYWLKDDHDFRYDDADLTDTNHYIGNSRFMPLPSARDGIGVFREQVPVCNPIDSGQTYRTFQICESAQIWFLEGRDFRSPKNMPPGPEKTIWGKLQKDWLFRTLKESKARYKLIVSPSPVVGPDEARKNDNHANPPGYKAEADEFFRFLTENGFRPEEVLLICGDRHWQYHSIHPSGFQEFCSGALNVENSKKGVPPGGKNSSDPEGKIVQKYLATEPYGGFLEVEITGGNLSLWFYSDLGKKVYKYP